MMKSVHATTTTSLLPKLLLAVVMVLVVVVVLVPVDLVEAMPPNHHHHSLRKATNYNMAATVASRPLTQQQLSRGDGGQRDDQDGQCPTMTTGRLAVRDMASGQVVKIEHGPGYRFTANLLGYRRSPASGGSSTGTTTGREGGRDSLHVKVPPGSGRGMGRLAVVILPVHDGKLSLPASRLRMLVPPDLYDTLVVDTGGATGGAGGARSKPPPSPSSKSSPGQKPTSSSYLMLPDRRMVPIWPPVPTSNDPRTVLAELYARCDRIQWLFLLQQNMDYLYRYITDTHHADAHAIAHTVDDADTDTHTDTRTHQLTHQLHFPCVQAVKRQNHYILTTPPGGLLEGEVSVSSRWS